MYKTGLFKALCKTQIEHIRDPSNLDIRKTIQPSDYCSHRSIRKDYCALWQTAERTDLLILKQCQWKV